MKKINKSALKEGYYYEYKSWYDALPEKLTVPKYQTEIFTKTISNREILDTYKVEPFTIEQAFAVAADCIPTLKNDYSGRVIYFMDGDTRCRLSVYRDTDGELEVDVSYVYLFIEWYAGDGVLFSNKVTENLGAEALSPSETLSLKARVEKLENLVEGLKELLS